MIYKLYKYIDGEWYWWCDYTDPVRLALVANELGSLGITIKVEVVEDGKMEWISVEEILPDTDKWVLGYSVSRTMEVVKYDSIMCIWDSVFTTRCYMKRYITHWMPLPEPQEVTARPTTS